MSFVRLLRGLFKKGEPCTPGVIELLYRWYGRSVYYASYYVLHDCHLAEDITQEVFLTALNKLNTLRDPTKVEAWLIRTAINRSCDLLRKNRPMLTLDEIADKQEEDMVLYRLLESENKKEILEALSLLPTPNQEVAYYRFYRGMNCREISEILEIPEGTVKSRLKRAVELVAEYLEKEASKENVPGKETGKNDR
ncbi:MAG TPA: RNA polymerase sigma factor [Syntrophomonadaceae bacterium]|nr:RNA polymerase sigma factor [Syntrophomonadaceae bacterium]